MNKLIHIQILNNTLLLTFKNGGYIKLNNLDYFDYQIKNCNYGMIFSEIDYLKFFSAEFEDYRFICASNGQAILIDVNESNFMLDGDENWQSNMNIFLKENFIVHNVEECITNEEEIRSKLRYVFEEINKEEVEKYCEENEIYIKNNIYKILSEIKACLNKDDFNFVIAYLMGNYDFEALKDGLKINISKSLKNAIRNHVKNIIVSMFEQHNLDLFIYNVTLIQKFSPPLKSKRLTYKVDAKQIGPDHAKTWHISHLSFSTINN